MEACESARLHHRLLLVANAAHGVPRRQRRPRLPAPTYAACAAGADQWHDRGGGHGRRLARTAVGYGGFYNPYFAQSPIVTGSWYQRPYPYHFDYYRYRWGSTGMPQTVSAVEMMPAVRLPLPAQHRQRTTPANPAPAH